MKSLLLPAFQAHTTLGRIPWLFPDPDAKRAEWQLLARLGLEDLKRREDVLKRALAHPAPLEATIKRLRKELQARVEHRKVVEELLSPLVKDEEKDVALLRVLGDKLPSTQSLASYVQNPLRDWGWPDTDENRLSLDLILKALAGAPKAERVLVLGAGAGRLSYDLHETLQPAMTIAADVNPFLLFIAERMASGKSLAFGEFPLAPEGPDAVAVPRKLKAPARVREGYHLVFADALNAPFVPGSFDVVVTPWVIDILPEDPRHFFPRLNALLRPGGRWVNSGPLGFDPGRPERAYTEPEVTQLVQTSGFAMRTASRERLPYLCSPASAQQRFEIVSTFAADKTTDVPQPAPFKVMPPWLLDPTRAVPPSEGLTRTAHMHAYYATVLGMIDGKRSVQSMAQELAAQHGLDPAELAQALIGFLANVYELSG